MSTFYLKSLPISNSTSGAQPSFKMMIGTFPSNRCYGLICVRPQKTYIELVTPSTSECYLIWKEDYCKYDPLDDVILMEYSGPRIQYDWCPY